MKGLSVPTQACLMDSLEMEDAYKRTLRGL